MQNTVAKAVEISVAVSISFENFNFVVAAFNETVCKWSSERIKYSYQPILHCFCTFDKPWDTAIMSGVNPV